MLSNLTFSLDSCRLKLSRLTPAFVLLASNPDLSEVWLDVWYIGEFIGGLGGNGGERLLLLFDWLDINISPENVDNSEELAAIVLCAKLGVFDFWSVLLIWLILVWGVLFCLT